MGLLGGEINMSVNKEIGCEFEHKEVVTTAKFERMAGLAPK